MEGLPVEQQHPRRDGGDDDPAVLSPKRKKGGASNDSLSSASLECEVSPHVAGCSPQEARSIKRIVSSRSISVPPKSIVIEQKPDEEEHLHDSWGGSLDATALAENRAPSSSGIHTESTPPRTNRCSSSTKDMTGDTQRLRERFSGGGSRRNLLSRSPSRSSFARSSSPSRKHSPTASCSSLAESEAICSFAQSFQGSTPAKLPLEAPPSTRDQQVLTIHREKLIESLAWFSCHTPLAVLEDLTVYEFEKWRSEMGQLNFGDGSMSSLSGDEAGVESVDSSWDGGNFVPQESQGRGTTMQLPYSVKRESAVLFVDITGFTKLSTLLDVEMLSKVINNYFDRIVQEVAKHHGDIIKFAGDAFFAEWRVQTNDEYETFNNATEPKMYKSHPLEDLTRSLKRSVRGRRGRRELSDCVAAAARCAASIVAQYSDYQVPIVRDRPFLYGGEGEDRSDSMLNVHCGIGAGSVVGLHVGDYNDESHVGVELRREYFILGDPIVQVSLAAEAASDGKVFASPEAVKILSERFDLSDVTAKMYGPVCIASREKSFLISSQGRASFDESERLDIPFTTHDALQKHCAHIDRSVLVRLHTQLALYVHPVVRGDELSTSTSHHGKAASRNATQSRQIAEAELRSVYTLFIKAITTPKLNGNREPSLALYDTLSNVMKIVCRELQRYSGHLRQFIIDDKGVVLIGTFGLRGSTFPNMVPNSALPATFAIHTALKELGIDNRIGATFGKVYCGVIGGIGRHEFSVMGAPVNLAARLMYSQTNNGILVDEAVQAQAGARFAFRALPPVKAKGYDRPVTIVEPLHAVSLNKRRGGPPSFVGRNREVRDLVHVATRIIDEKSRSETSMAFVVGESGMGKTLVAYKTCEEIRQLCSIRQKKVALSRSSSTETEQRSPLSSFRKILLAAIKEACICDGTISSAEEQKRRGSFRRQKSQRSVRGPGLLTRQVSQRSQRLPPGPLLRQMSQRSYRGLPKQDMSRRRLSSRRFSQSSVTTVSNSARSEVVPYFEKLCWVCEELDYPYEYADIVGSQLLRVEGASPAVSHVDGHIPTVDEVVDFLASAYLRMIDLTDLTLIIFDDFQWIDALTWKTIRVLCQRVNNLFIICAMRSHDRQVFRRMSSVQVWHGQMQSRIVEISLGPLDLAEVKQLIGLILGYEESSIGESLCTDVYNKTGGVPIYAVQLLEGIKRNKTVSMDVGGTLEWTDAARKEQCRIGANSLAVIEESFLNRFDSLDRSVREILQTGAVLGESFTFFDVVRVHPELNDHDIELSLEAAVNELIIIEDVFDEDDDDLSLLSDLGLSIGGDSRPPVHGSGDRCFQFSHAMWRTSVLNKMLKERRIELHRLIAYSIESEQVVIAESGDIARVLSLVEHWKACGEFCKAAPLSLTVGVRLEEWDLLDQCLNLYKDSLDMCYEDTLLLQGQQETNSTEDDNWVIAATSPVALDLVLRLHVRIGRCLFLLGRQGESEEFFKDAFKIITSSDLVTEKNRALMLPIVAGLCSICYERMDYEKSSLRELETYLQHYVEEAERDGEPVHRCRAISMEASFFARIGRFERALKSVDALKNLYAVRNISKELSDEYGRDYALQCLADSVLWFRIVGEDSKTYDQVDVVVNELFPHVQDADLDRRLETLFPVLMAMKEMSLSHEAHSTLMEYVIIPYRDPYRSLSFKVPTWLPVYNPLTYLLESSKMEESGNYDYELLGEMEEWVLQSEVGHFPFDLRRKGNLLVGEICWRLAKQGGLSECSRRALLEKMRSQLYYVVYHDNDDKSDLFMVDRARVMLAYGEDQDSD